MANHYAEAIRCLRSLRHQSEDSVFDILYLIAEAHPSYIVEAFAEKFGSSPNKSGLTYLQEMDRLFAAEGRNAKIRLIKMYRDATQVGLGDSKAFVEDRYKIGTYGPY